MPVSVPRMALPAPVPVVTRVNWIGVPAIPATEKTANGDVSFTITSLIASGRSSSRGCPVLGVLVLLAAIQTFPVPSSKIVP